MHEQLRGVPATLWYRVDEIRLLELLAKPAELAAADPAPVGTKRTNWKGRNVPTRRAETYQLEGPKGASKKAPFGPTFNEQRLHRDYTETTTTTPNPSSSTERAAEPEAARGGSSGVQDRNPKDRDGDHGITALESNEEQTATRGEVANARRAELAYPAKLTERERDDIAAQVEPLPHEVAQQMLDVIEVKRQAGQIKTNPAAVLRGIVRKYRADPAAFDPSPGFGNAEARRRRAETEARARAEAERREREREAMRTLAPEAMDARRQAFESMRRALRGH
ncbi:MAG: hypothetical protein JNJ76_05675 [Candidatus Competibacter sp.]|nr:hypothetical protein [Candidatus Competibacter sp.]